MGNKQFRIFVVALFITFYTVISLALLGMVVKTQYLFFGLNIEGMMEGTTLRPFAYRVLPVAIVRGITDITPLPVQYWLVELAQQYNLSDFITPRFFYPAFEFEGIMFLVVMGSFLLGYIIMLRKLTLLFFPGSFLLPLAAPLLGIFALFPFEFPRSYPYDFSVLLLWTACFYAMAQRKWGAYLLLFAYNCLNKETAIVLVLLYGIHFFSTLPRPQFIRLGIRQVAIYACIRGAIMYAYRGNPGPVMDFNFSYQFFDEMMTGFNFERLMAVTGAIFITLADWQNKPLFLRQSLWLFLVFYLLYRWGGCCGEWRVLYEIFPAITILATHTLIAMTGIERPQRQEF